MPTAIAPVRSRYLGAIARLNVALTGEGLLTDKNIQDVVNDWFDPDKRQTVVEEFGEIGDWQVGKVTDMSHLFFGKTNFNEDLSRWDTSKVKSMMGMFRGASSFNHPVGEWDTSNVTNMSDMFSGASSFNQPLENWDTSSVQTMIQMFHRATSFNQKINKWNIGSVNKKTGMLHMFLGASSLWPLPYWYNEN